MHLRRAERVTGALSLALALLGLAGGGPTGQSYVEGPTVSAGWSGHGLGVDGIVPLANGHAHNDYLQKVPLSDAIARGFTSVEVDVWRHGSRLLVGHEAVEAAVLGRTLQSLYLDPLAAWVAEHDGTVFGDPAVPFTLVVDVKSAGAAGYEALDAALAPYSSMLTRFTPRGAEHGAVTVVVSGNRVPEAMAAQAVRYAAYDGRIGDLTSASHLPTSLMPMVSVKWTEHFRWDGRGVMPATERARLKSLADTAHAQGRLLRLWDTPAPDVDARTAVWQAELDAGVDLLNVDNLDAGQRFLLAYRGPARSAAAADPATRSRGADS
jgi:hypothetical protein